MADRQSIARTLRDAYRSGPVPSFRESLDPIDVESAYAIQAINTAFWCDQGRRIIGRKIGLTSTAVQTQLGVDRPDFGVLFDDMQIANGGRLDPERVIQPKAEAEVALILGSDLSNGAATPDDILRAADHAVAAIEIVDSRIAEWKITFADTVSDNGSSAFFVLGEDRKPLPGLDLYTCGMALEVDGVLASIGIGAACLGHPLAAAAWLANTLAERGEPLRAGDVLLTGALGPMVAITPGQNVKAAIGGLGSVGFTFGEA